MPSTPPAESSSLSVRIIGNGRAGGAFAAALHSAGLSVHGPLGRDDDLSNAAADVDVVLIAVSDSAISAVAAAIEPARAAVIHVSGVTGLDSLDTHPNVGSVHPLIALPDPVEGARLLASGITFAVAGHAISAELAQRLGGTAVQVPEDKRAAYHAAASVASNHVVALWAQVERIARRAGVPAPMYLQLLLQSAAAAAEASAEQAITGPAMRGDWPTLERHLSAIGRAEQDLYLVLAAEAARLGGRSLPTRITETHDR